MFQLPFSGIKVTDNNAHVTNPLTTNAFFIVLVQHDCVWRQFRIASCWLPLDMTFLCIKRMRIHKWMRLCNSCKIKWGSTIDWFNCKLFLLHSSNCDLRDFSHCMRYGFPQNYSTYFLKTEIINLWQNKTNIRFQKIDLVSLHIDKNRTNIIAP